MLFMSLNAYQNIDYLEADSPDTLKDLIRQIPLPISPVSGPLPQGGKWVFWFVPTQPIKKVKVAKESFTKELKNGTGKG